MRIKTMIIILITVLLTVVIMQNTGAIFLNFLFFTFRVSRLVVLLAVAIVAFIIGVMVGRPGKPKYVPGHDEEIEAPTNKTNTLSNEDRDYIS